MNFLRGQWVAGLLILNILSASAASGGTNQPTSGIRLARVEVAGRPENFPLPAHALLQDSVGKDYLLVFATQEQLNKAGWPWKQLARDCPPEGLVLATEMRPGARAAAAALSWSPLMDDGCRWLLQATEQQAEELAELGFALQRLQPEPISWPVAAVGRKDGGPGRTMPDPLVWAMVDAVQATNLYSLVARLSGQEPLLAAGGPYLVRTRHTSSGQPLTNALEASFNRLQSLGLNPFYHVWSSGTYLNRNLVANLPGSSHSNEWVLVTAHVDDMPTGTLAPGADDNATGSAAVLMAAGVCAQYQFERSMRFVLFTGEEQGLLGSARYATAVQAAGENVVAVFNMDMLGWDGVAPPTFQLHTRTPGTIGYSNDLPIATTFTNAVAAYGLSTALAPVVKADGLTASDHASFWNRGYAAIAAVEDYGGDFNPYYHSTADTLSRINLGYFTAAVKASVATVAHLASPMRRVTNDVLELAASDWNPSSGVGARAFVARHVAGATETGPDIYDIAADALPPIARTSWLKVSSYPYQLELATDSRPTDSESPFSAELGLVTGGSATCAERVHVEFLTPPDPQRIYLALLRTDLPQLGGFLCVTNLRDVVLAGRYVALPGLTNLVETSYGSLQLACRFLDTSAAACPLHLLSADVSTIQLSTQGQVGAHFLDEVQFATSLRTNAWSTAASFTNYVLPTPENFDVGWSELLMSVGVNALPDSAQYFFRLKRTWLAP